MMNKADIKNGIILIQRNEKKCYVIKDKAFIEIKGIVVSKYNINFYLKNYNDDLTHKYNNTDDILEIQDVNGNIIWEREEDWSSIPIGTVVKVKNKENEVWRNKRFVCYKANNSVKFVTLSDDLSEIEYWERCQLV